MMWNRPFDMMYGWSDWGWFGPLHFVVPLLFWTLVVTAIIFVVRRGFRSGQASLVGHRLTSLELREQRYARGEINRDEYLQKKADLIGSSYWCPCSPELLARLQVAIFTEVSCY